VKVYLLVDALTVGMLSVEGFPSYSSGTLVTKLLLNRTPPLFLLSGTFSFYFCECYCNDINSS